MKLIIINKNGEQLDLLNNNRYFILSGCESLHGIETDIATSTAPYLDGAIIENVKAQPRGIILTFTLKPDITKSIDFFTSIIKSKQQITLIEEDNSGKQIQIKGIATIPPYSRMQSLCKMQLIIRFYWYNR